MKSKYLYAKWCIGLVLAVMLNLLSGCSTGPLTGYVFTNVKYPLTRDMRPTPVPGVIPKEGIIIEIKEPVSGIGLYARINSNAIGDIAEKNGLTKLYFADQQVFSVLGIWTSYKVTLYGE